MKDASDTEGNINHSWNILKLTVGCEMKNRKQHIKMLHAEKLVGWDGRVEPKIVAGRWIEKPSGHSALDTLREHVQQALQNHVTLFVQDLHGL